jgi:SAP domain-containing ribonucleoprotein
MSDYSGQTVSKLQELLKARQLPYSGKKAELIERLREADKAAEANGALPISMSSHIYHANPNAEAEAAPPAPATTSAPPQQTPDTIAQEAAAEPAPAAEPASTTAEPTADAATPTDANLAASTDYALHLPTSNVDDEIAKRKARAARFGTANTEKNEAAETEDKNLERAKRFGIQPGDTAIGKLDVALPTEGAKGRRRGPVKEGESTPAASDDPGLLRRGRGRGGRFGGRGRGRREGSVGAKPSGVAKVGAGYSDKDRAAADARKKRFAAQG